MCERTAAQTRPDSILRKRNDKRAPSAAARNVDGRMKRRRIRRNISGSELGCQNPIVCIAVIRICINVRRKRSAIGHVVAYEEDRLAV